MNGGNVGGYFVEEVSVGFGVEREMENVVPFGEGEGAVESGLLCDFRGGKGSVSGATNVGKSESGDVGKLGGAGEIEIERGDGSFPGSGDTEFQDGDGRTIIKDGDGVSLRGKQEE